MKLYARQKGDGADVISLHGLFGSQENLGMINRGLSQQFRVHGLDVRNHGRSPHSSVMNFQAMAEDVLEYMDDHQLASVHLVGHSMGGKIAMTIALMAPDRVNKLAVIDIAPVTYQVRRHDSILEGLSSISLQNLSGRKDADQFLRDYVSEKEIRQFLLKNLYKDEVGNYQWRVNLPVIDNQYLDIMAGQEYFNSVFLGKTLFIKGGQSDYILAEHRELVLKLFPNTTMRVVPETGHWVHAQKPELVTKLIVRFLTKEL